LFDVSIFWESLKGLDGFFAIQVLTIPLRQKRRGSGFISWQEYAYFFVENFLET
jgi:hypothetical protein